jgi:transposase
MEGRVRRKEVQLRAAEMCEPGTDARQVARSLRVSTKSVCQWRRDWRAGGEKALASKGPGGSPCKLDQGQVVQLRGVSFLLHRLGFTPRVPAHRAFERDENAVAEWRTAT